SRGAAARLRVRAALRARARGVLARPPRPALVRSRARERATLRARASGGRAVSALLEVRGLRVEFRGRRGARVLAVDGVDLDVARGESVALVGESGSGKSTIARAIAGFVAPSAGTIRFGGEDLARFDRARRARAMQMVFQDPFASLDPRWT